MSRERRRLFINTDDELSAEPGQFGCPMLVRAHCGPLRGRMEPVFRCSLAWALHGDDDVTRCRLTDVVSDCWKVHPERFPAVAVIEVSEQTFDDPTMRIAGD